MSAWVGIQVVQFLGVMFDNDIDVIDIMVKARKIRYALMDHNLVDIPSLLKIL